MIALSLIISNAQAASLEESEPIKKRELPSRIRGAKKKKNREQSRVFLLEPVSTVWQMPPLNIGAPSGYAMDWGNLSFGTSFVSKTRRGHIADGALSTAIGFGDSRKHVGFQLSFTIVDLDPLLEDGNIGFKANHVFGNGFATSIGMDTIYVWGGQVVETTYPVTLAVSKAFYLKDSPAAPFGVLSMSAGIKIGKFIESVDGFTKTNNIGVRGSLSMGVRVLPPIGMTVEYDSISLNAGLGLAPFRRIPVAITLAALSIKDRYDSPPRFLLAVGYGTSFFDEDFPVNTITSADTR